MSKTTELIERIQIEGGEIAVYRDAEGYHAERWSDRRQMIVRQSGDHKTAKAAIEAAK